VGRAVDLSAKTAGYASTHTPLGVEGLWKHKGWQLPAYIQNVAVGLMKDGHDRSEAIQIAIGVIKNWASGGGKVTPEVRAASAKALAEWEALKARADSSKSEHSRQREAIELVVRRQNQFASTVLDDGGSGKGFNITDRQAQDLTGFSTRQKSDYNARRMSGMTHDEAIRRAKGQSVRGM
jgi:hypothetical protein